MKNVSAGKLVLSIVLALAGGLFPPVWLFVPMLGAFLYAFCGWLPAGVLLVSAGSAVAAYGAIGVLYGALYALPPLIVMICCMNAHKPFFSQMHAALAAAAAGVVLAVGAAYLFGGGSVAGQIARLWRETMDGLGNTIRQMNVQEAAVITPMYEAYSAITQVDMQNMLALNLPSMALCLIAINGGLGVLWTAWLRARHSQTEKGEYAAVSTWHLPTATTGGMLLVLVVAVLLLYTPIRGAECVYLTVLMAVEILAIAQAAGSIARRLRMAGVRSGLRTGLIACATLFAAYLMVIYGAISALFGTNGLVSGYVRKHMNNRDGGDDEL